MKRAMYRLAARAKSSRSDALVRRALELRSLVGQGPLVGVPPIQRALVIAPHPDDESLACGGLIAALTARGATVAIIVATDGEATIGATTNPGDIARARREEARTAAGDLGVDDVTFAGLADGDAIAGAQLLGRRIDEVAARLGPDAVVTTWFGDGHRDHQAMTAGLAASSLPRDVEIWGGEVWTPVPANRIVPLDDAAWAAKTRAVERHATAMGAFDVTAMLGLQRYRSVHGLSGEGHAEAFLAMALSDWLALADVRSAAT